MAGVDLGAAIHRVASEGLLLRGGGHKMAAGLTVEPAHMEQAMARLAELLARQGAGTLGPADLKLDGLLTSGAATIQMIGEMETAGPFGAGAPAPRFAFPDQRVSSLKVFGNGHIRARFSDGTGTVEGIAFGAAETPLGQALKDGSYLHVAGRVEVDEWQGRQRVQLRLEDVAQP